MAKEIASKMDHIAAQLLAHAELQADKAKAVGKYSAKVIKAKGQQAQAQYDAEAEAEAAGSETPVGPPASGVPFPPARNPSQSVAGSTMPSVEDLFGGDPGSVAGGGGIQAATGGMGRAAPDETAPPFIVSQTQSQGAQLVTPGLGGFSDRVPMTETRTNVTPNVLSAGDVLQARIAREGLAARQANYADQSAVRWANYNLNTQKLFVETAKARSSIQANNALTRLRIASTNEKDRKYLTEKVAEYGDPLADLMVLAKEGRINAAEYEHRKKTILGSIPQPEMKAAVTDYANRTLSTKEANRSLRGRGMAIKTNPDGTTTIVQGNAAEIMGAMAEDEANTQRTLAYRKLQSALSGVYQVDEVLNLVNANKGLVGAPGTVARLSTQTLGAIGSFVPKARAQLISELQRDFERVKQTGTQEEVEEAQVDYIKALTEINKYLNVYQPTDVGKLGVMVNALRSTLAQTKLGGELNIRGYEILGREFVDPTGFKSVEQAIAELNALKTDFEHHERLGRSDFARMGGNPNLTTRQILGLDPMPKLETTAPEVTWEDLYGVPSAVTNPKVAPPDSDLPYFDPSEMR